MIVELIAQLMVEQEKKKSSSVEYSVKVFVEVSVYKI